MHFKPLAFVSKYELCSSRGGKIKNLESSREDDKIRVGNLHATLAFGLIFKDMKIILLKTMKLRLTNFQSRISLEFVLRIWICFQKWSSYFWSRENKNQEFSRENYCTCLDILHAFQKFGFCLVAKFGVHTFCRIKIQEFSRENQNLDGEKFYFGNLLDLNR